MHVGYVLLNCDLGSEEYVLEELRHIPQVVNAHLTFGAYDVIAEVRADDQASFDHTVSTRIRRLARVLSTMTLSVIQ